MGLSNPRRGSSSARAAVLDLHLMIVEPEEKYLAEFAARGAAHAEPCTWRCGSEPAAHARSIRELVGRRGSPVEGGRRRSTPATDAGHHRMGEGRPRPRARDVGEPGFGGQTFIPAVYPKIRQIRTMLAAAAVDVSIDGGVKIEHARARSPSTARSILVAGSRVFERRIPPRRSASCARRRESVSNRSPPLPRERQAARARPLPTP